MLEIENLRKTFSRGASAVVALDGISLRLAKGEFVTVIGSNGAGKSTLLNVVNGALRPDDGRIKLNGQDWTAVPEHLRARRIARVEQDPGAVTAARLTVEENMALALTTCRRRGLGFGVTRLRRQTFGAALAQLGMGLEGRLGVRMSTLSGGQRQAISVLMATLAEPEVLLLDEHTAALDPHAANQVMTLTERLVRAQSLTTLMVTHNMERALSHGDRLIMLHAGRILFDVSGDQKFALTVPGLIDRFKQASGQTFADDEALLVQSGGKDS
ncbi:MAG: ATP-binding cassette domain-containing protein [Chloroflexi bacterium]|nr:ATP-binding cassette domain-containing protein [Chloroflexota bacterium]